MRIAKKKKVVWLLVLVACAGVLAYIGVLLVRWYIDGKNIETEITEIENTTEVVEVGDSETTELVNPPNDKDSDYWYYVKLPLIDVNLTELKKKNPDTVGFLSVAGTNINYPVVQAGDNTYYLTRSFKKKPNRAGWVFMDYRNNPNLENQNTVIYGHGRLDTTMFGSLKNILNTTWVNNKDNYVVRYVTETEMMLFWVFAVYEVPVESYYIQIGFGSNNEYQKWLDTMIGRSKYMFNTTVNIKDRVLTLSTCKDTRGNRVVMHAKLIKKDQRG